MSDLNLLTLICGKEDIARNLLIDSNFTELGKKSIPQLQKLGLTKKKAITLQSALEIGRRRQFEHKDCPVITSSRDCHALLASDLIDLDHEQFHMLVLNKTHKVIKKLVMSIGGMDATIVDIKLIFKRVLEFGGCAIVVAHNHPSGSLRPSQADIDITKKIKQGCQLLDITMLDHIIVAANGYYSFADEGMI